MKLNYYKDKYIELYVEDGIMYHVYGKDVVITLEIAQHITQKRIEASGGFSYPLLIDSRDFKSMSKEARHYWSKSQDAQKYVLAGAGLIYNPIYSLIGNAFLMIDKPIKPFKLFTEKAAALKWLDHYKNVN